MSKQIAIEKRPKERLFPWDANKISVEIQTYFHRLVGSITSLKNTDTSPKQTQNSGSYNIIQVESQIKYSVAFLDIQINFTANTYKNEPKYWNI